MNHSDRGGVHNPPTLSFYPSDLARVWNTIRGVMQLLPHLKGDIVSHLPPFFSDSLLLPGPCQSSNVSLSHLSFCWPRFHPVCGGGYPYLFVFFLFLLSTTRFLSSYRVFFYRYQPVPQFLIHLKYFSQCSLII